MAKQPVAYGGQAVIEGVMFGGKHSTVTAIRRKDRSIEYFSLPKKSYKGWYAKARKIPFLRGIFGIIEASANGSKHLNFAAERYDVEPGEEEYTPQESSKLVEILGIAVVGVLSFFFGKLLFTVVPALLEEYLFRTFPLSFVIHNLIEGGIKIILLLIYLFAISRTPIIKRLFQYHGAEHKVINAFEAGKDLTVANVQAASRLHYRCGSSFIIFSVLVGVAIYSFFEWDSTWERIWIRILLIPVVLGVSYEVLQLTNKVRDIQGLQWLGYPGLWLQYLTTSEPSDDQVEVSIASFNKMRQMEMEYDADNTFVI